MENAADALKMAAWVLIFVVALSISMNAFSQARQSIDEIVAYKDREFFTTYIDQSNSSERIVGYESIIPAIYRAYKENYKIIFTDYNLYEKEIYGTTKNEEINYIDLEKEKISESAKEEFIKRIIYGNNKFQFDEDDKLYTSTHFPNVKFDNDGLYSKINGQTFKEELGVYYQEEVEGGTSTPDSNKTEKRVITYTKIQNTN